jgi:hypothetical protein
MEPEVLQGVLMWLTPVMYLAGLVTAIALPYINAKREDPSIEFDVEYIKWQIIFGLVGFIPAMAAALNVQQMEAWASLGAMGLFVAFAAGFGFGRGGREAQKTAKK